MSSENAEAKLEEIPWPKPGDILFQSGDDWWNNACLNYGGNPWEMYACGYKDAADILAESVKATERRADVLIYPITFLYRHYLELRLKELIIHGQGLLDRDLDLKHVHRLDILWKSCRQILEEVWPGSDTGPLDSVENCIKQFVQIDPESMSFRYPATKDGKRTLPNLNPINIRNLQEVINRTSSLLEAASSAISAYLDYKADAQSCY